MVIRKAIRHTRKKPTTNKNKNNMEIIVKIIKALLIKDNGEVDKATASQLKEAITWMTIGGLIAVGFIVYMSYAEDCEDEDDTETEYYEQPEQGEREAWL